MNKYLKSGIDPLFGTILLTSLVLTVYFEWYCAKHGLPSRNKPFHYDMWDYFFPWMMDNKRYTFVNEVLKGNLGPYPYAYYGPKEPHESLYGEIVTNKIINEIIEEYIDEIGKDIEEFLNKELENKTKNGFIDDEK